MCHWTVGPQHRCSWSKGLGCLLAVPEVAAVAVVRAVSAAGVAPQPCCVAAVADAGSRWRLRLQLGLAWEEAGPALARAAGDELEGQWQLHQVAEGRGKHCSDAAQLADVEADAAVGQLP